MSQAVCLTTKLFLLFWTCCFYGSFFQPLIRITQNAEFAFFWICFKEETEIFKSKWFKQQGTSVLWAVVVESDHILLYWQNYCKPRPSSIVFAMVDIWCAAVAKGVWKDTADCRERQVGVRYAGAWGKQVLWSVRLCPPSWWSKTGITATDDHGCWPDQNAQCGRRCQQRWAVSRQCQLEKYYFCCHYDNTVDRHRKTKTE